ncbi:MAG TPA: PilW family protein [Gammaproteobacteria bacterium]
MSNPLQDFGRAHGRRRATGMTLVELMVALAIGSFLLLGAVTVFVQSRSTFRVADSVSRLQENARFVLDRLEPDIRMAGYFGLTSRPTKLLGRAGPDDPAGLGPQECETNWAINVEAVVEATNNGYAWGTGCDPFGGTAAADADTLIVRRVSEDEITGSLDANTLYVQSARSVDGQIFQGTTVPTLPGTSQTHRLIVNGYYVSQTSTLSTTDNTIPSLRVKRLTSGAGGPVVVDEEVLPGVEDFQVQLGVDTDAVGAAGRGSIDRYVNPGDGILVEGSATFIPDAQVLAVRIWVRLRALDPEVGYTDSTNYVYADQNVAAFNDAFRRIVVSKTIFLRNARTVI